MSASAKSGKQSMRVRDIAHDRFYYLETASPLASGGEAFIYDVRGEPSLVAKIYKQRHEETADKLAVMLANPPKNPTERQGHQSYAWPTALISPPDASAIIGFLMPKITGMRIVFDFYNPGQRRDNCPSFDYRYLLQTARNLAGIMREVHSRGYVVGDVNQKNIYVSDSTLVTLLDTDSFQILDPQTGRLFLCRVQTDGFIAPELFKTRRKDIERTAEQDLFGLAVVIFHLLMEGVHPFSGVDPGPGEPRKAQERIISGDFPYAAGSRLRPMPIAPPFEILHSDLRALFLRCFVDGHSDPRARPTAKEWQQALSKAAQELQCCKVNEQHYYGAHMGACPWCERVSRQFKDPFPSKSQVQSNSQAGNTPEAHSNPPFQFTYNPPSGRGKWVIGVVLVVVFLIVIMMRC